MKCNQFHTLRDLSVGFRACKVFVLACMELRYCMIGSSGVTKITWLSIQVSHERERA